MYSLFMLMLVMNVKREEQRGYKKNGEKRSKVKGEKPQRFVGI